MRQARVLPACVSAVLLGGCASAWERSYDRWYDYRFGQGPYAEWAGCIDTRSRHYLDYPRPVEGTESQLFAHVLADCGPLMTGPAWQDDGAGKLRRLIADAYRAFEGVDAEIRGALEASII